MTKRAQFDPVKVRIARAERALAQGAYTIRRDGSQGSVYRWTLENGRGKTYIIEYNRETKAFACTCPDFQNRGKRVGTCKHIESIKLWERRRRQANGEARTSAPNTNGARTDANDLNDLAALVADLVAAIREQNDLLKTQNQILDKYLRQIDLAVAKGLGIA